MIEPVITAAAADPDRQARLKRIRLFSLVLAGCFVVLAMLLTVGLLFYWLSVSAGSIAADAQIPQEWLSELGLGRRLIGFAISFVPLACLVFALMAARRCFGAFASGNFFGQGAISNLRYFGLGLLASALLKPVSAAASSVLLSWNAPAGQHRLTLGVDSDTMLALLAACIVAVITWVMAEASALAEENAQFI
ncbi:DUF2975 domain-containing protein [Mesorhizobium sp. M7D.F.Ca.US.004.03.1.1]|uniref:DUF2975 domain-containing protein n=1 Tax=Mesorhizobium sp. M7D.F.Ca.US.004.03.1.1 TaxID=2496702 RepID=UPI000FCA3A67|nr:DUF2975 domain-containing protein [Mesorhizobium sp. M7D.F.Ca.US.004.03.1.1]RVA21617.1 DUF2975 domain-containing protein [Mesorhizobium sp. M7D.F.Ca.US.004.03.1.1]